MQALYSVLQIMILLDALNKPYFAARLRMQWGRITCTGTQHQEIVQLEFEGQQPASNSLNHDT